MKDTAPEINAMIFVAMMRKTPEERLLMGFDMMATARELVWSGIGPKASEAERRRLFSLRFHGREFLQKGGVESRIMDSGVEETGQQI